VIYIYNWYGREKEEWRERERERKKKRERKREIYRES